MQGGPHSLRILTLAMMTSDNDNPLGSSDFSHLVVATSKAISDRQLLTQSFVVSPIGMEGLTG